jgi:hypothetical protein
MVQSELRHCSNSRFGNRADENEDEMSHTYRAVVSCVLVLIGASTASASEPLVRAHAHNDYQHERPLFDALAHGFCSVEADIFLVSGQLLVGHTRFELREARTLESLYLDPLKQRVADNTGRVYKDGPPFTLLIDIKSDGATTYTALRKVLAKYAEMLTTVSDGKVKPGAIGIIISGNRPQTLIASAKTRFAGIDGRLADLETSKPSHLMPLISDRWTTHFRWRGTGPFPEHERMKLKTIVEQAHRRGQRVRFWATPEREALWKELAAAEVDLIGTDDLPKLQRFLQDRK